METDRATLEPLVRRVLANDTARVQEWSVVPLGGGTLASMGDVPVRISGRASDDEGAMHPWSMVLKVLRAPRDKVRLANQLDPGHQFYWKREALVYGSELLDAIPAGIAVPRCYGIDDAGDEIRLWMEDVAEPGGAHWSLAHYGTAACHLGRFNGAYLVGRSLPEAPWLCRDLLRWREEFAAPFWDGIAAGREDSRMRRGWPGEVADRAYRVWSERDSFLDALDRLPRVLCHGDFERRNLFARAGAGGTTETVAIDWAQAGPRAVGADLAALVAQSVLWAQDWDPADLGALSRCCYEGYLAGLRQAGWAADARLVRLGYAATVALQFVAFAGAIKVGLAGDDERPRLEAWFGATLEAVLDRHAVMQPFALDLADEARSLLGVR